MADKTRVDEVEEEIEAVEEKRGEEDFTHIVVTCLKQISVSLAQLVDASGE